MKMSKLNSPNLLLPNLSPSKFRTRVYNHLFKGKKPLLVSEENDKKPETTLANEDTVHASLSDDEPETVPGLHPTTNDSEVIYKGAKTFWRARATLDITLVAHKPFHCLEIIGYNAKTDVEGPRLYVSEPALLSKFEASEIESKAETEKESRIRARKSFQWDSLVAEVRHQLMVQFITSRLNITPHENSPQFDLFLVPSFSDVIDESTGKIDILLSDPPSGLKPYPTTDRKRVVPLDELQKGLDDLNKDTKTVGTHFATVHKLVTEARSVLGFHRGRDDSFAFLSTYRQRKSGEPYRRTSVDDSHLLDNSNNNSVLAAALKKVREMIHLGSSDPKMTNPIQEEELPPVISDPNDTEHIKNCDLLLVNGPASTSPRKFTRMKSQASGLRTQPSSGNRNTWQTVSQIEDLVDRSVSFAPRDCSRSPREREEVQLPPLKSTNNIINNNPSIPRLPLTSEPSLKRQSTNSSLLRKEKSIANLKKSKSRKGLVVSRGNSTRKTPRRPGTSSSTSSKRIVPVTSDTNNTNEELEDDLSVPSYARWTLARKNSLEKMED